MSQKPDFSKLVPRAKVAREEAAPAEPPAASRPEPPARRSRPGPLPGPKRLEHKYLLRIPLDDWERIQAIAERVAPRGSAHAFMLDAIMAKVNEYEK